MKICVSARKNSLDAQIDPRFGRCQYLVIVDSETLEFKAVSNPAKKIAHGAGIKAAQTAASEGAEVVITGNVGPNAFQALSTTGLKVLTSTSGTVKEAVEKYMKGKLKEVDSPSVPGHFGIGGHPERG